MNLLIVIAAVVVAWLLFGKRTASASTTKPAGSPAQPVPTAVPDSSIPDATAQIGAPQGPEYQVGTPVDVVDNIAQAWANLEGTGNTLNWRNNNPGNLRAAPNQTGTNEGFATFADVGDGWDALNNYIVAQASAHPDWDFYDLNQHILGQDIGSPMVTDQGDAGTRAEYMASELGVDPGTTIASLLGFGDY